MELTATKREQFGRALKGLRAEGFLPAELYGHGVENLHLSVSAKDFRKVFKAAGESTMIDLLVDGKKHPVMIQEVLTNPRSDVVVGVDFYQVRLDQKLKLKVPLIFVGESAGVKEKQGILIKALSEVEVEAFPQDLPHTIEVNIAKLADIGSSIRVKELPVSADVKLLDDPEFVVATITARMTEEQEAKLAAVADVTTIKSEVEEKKEERAKDKEATGDAGAPATAEVKK
jgi:large subunit ribosomal protein L25